MGIRDRRFYRAVDRILREELQKETFPLQKNSHGDLIIT